MMTLERLLRECDELSGELARLVKTGEAVPAQKLDALLDRAIGLHAQMQTRTQAAAREAN